MNSPFRPSSTHRELSPLGGLSRPITSCLPCRSRKVKCDRRQPLCLVCERGDYACSYVSKPQSPGLVSELNRVTKSSTPKISSSTLARINPGLQRLGNFIAQANAYKASEHCPSSESFTPTRSTPTPLNASPPQPRSQEDALILDNGVPHFVSGKHWAWMAAELQDIQSVLTESQNSSPEQALEDIIWDADSPMANGATFWPDTREDCYLLLNVFLANIDPIHRIIHRPSLARRFDEFILTHYLLEDDHSPGKPNTNIDTFEPLVMSIFYAAVNSIKDTDMATMFSMDKSYLLNRYRIGTEVYLKRQKFMTSRSFEVLQAFVIFLTAQYREDDMGKVWPLTGLAIRIATVHGLHRDPLALPLGTIDVIQVELRRRLWAQICYLDFRAAEDHGFAPSIHESDFDTCRPVSLDDIDLIEGVAPSAALLDIPKFTDMTIYLLRTTAVQYYGRIIQVALASRKRLRPVGEAEVLIELQGLLNTAETLASEFEKNLDDLVRYCDKRVSMQSMALDLRDHLKTKFWVMFWIQISRQDREKIINPAMRRNIFVDAATAVENWCTIASSKACEPFQWHIFSHAGFYLILYVLSELRSSGFQSPEWADLRQRGLQLANAIYEIRGQHTTGAWPAIIWLVNRIRFQQGLSSDIANNQYTGTGQSENDHLTMIESFAGPLGPAGTGFGTADFMGLVNVEDFDFADFSSLDPMGFHGLSQ
ncbi:Transcription factor [Penicillium coprophilum]|uniref:Transcription factor n=1 Tax=Penicillium coprophilum TaxID=36646 RepID=UPI002383A462|nr:Transcription factor [Penicillium coprophilum]KAJ5150390.1 Transcription factor [Penicillium coprophilum]